MTRAPILGENPFDTIAEDYDRTFSETWVGRTQRAQVWIEADRTFRAGQRILEINCGTGIDAVHFANRGINVLACDSSARMIGIAGRRRDSCPNGSRIELRCIPTEDVSVLQPEEPYDGVFSNFSGLNCVSDLKAAARGLARLVRPGGKAILCLFGRLCLWEILFNLTRRDFPKAFRRLNNEGILASLGTGSGVMVRYPGVSSLRGIFAPHFRLERWRGVGVLVPPSYLENLALRFQWFFARAAEVESRLGTWPGIRSLADHMLLTFERSAEDGS
jgi:SAM-dependent methyltransferase